MLRSRHVRRLFLAIVLGVVTTFAGAWYLGSKPGSEGRHYQLVRIRDQVWDVSLAGRNWTSREAYAEYVYTLPDEQAIRKWDDEYRTFGPGPTSEHWLFPGLRTQSPRGPRVSTPPRSRSSLGRRMTA